MVFVDDEGLEEQFLTDGEDTAMFWTPQQTA